MAKKKAKGQIATKLFGLSHVNQSKQKFPSYVSATFGKIIQAGQVHTEGGSIMTASAQIAGNTSANIAEVEAGTKALRVTLRAEDYGSLGIYSLSQVSGLVAAGMSAATRVYSFRWGDSTRFALVKRVTLSVGNDATAFAAGSAIFNMFRVLSFSASDTTNGTELQPSGNQNKLRTSGMGTTLLSSAYILNTSNAGITGGTLTTPDTNPIASLVTGVLATAGSILLAPYPLWDQRPGEHPLLLAQNEGFIIKATVPATGTWKFAVTVNWSELTAY